MNLAIIGTGLVSPIGLTPLQHACFPRAGIGLHPPSAFVDADGEAVPVLHCPWLGAKLAVAPRLAALARAAMRSAADVIGRVPDLAMHEVALTLCLGAPRAGLSEADRQQAAGSIAEAATAPLRRVLTGAASFYAGLADADRMITTGELRAMLLVAVDSFVSLDAVRAELEMAPATWGREPPPLSEAAAAVLVMGGSEAREQGLSLGTIGAAGLVQGEGSDDDDRAADGAALSALLEHVPSTLGKIARMYGQQHLDRLRMTEWTCASARNADRFDPLVTTACIETWTGRVGAAAGGAHLTYGVAAERHHARDEHPAGAGPFAAWVMSRDGVRGLCAATAGER